MALGCMHYQEGPRTEPTVGIHCLSETETLAHVLGTFPHCEILRNSRHHQIRSMIANELRKIHQVEEEVHGISIDGSHRRIDIS